MYELKYYNTGFILILFYFVISCAETTPTTTTSVPSHGHAHDLVSFLFNDFCRRHNKTYNTTQIKHRIEVFKQNLDRITHIKSIEKGTAQYVMNFLGDLTDSEFAKNFLGHKHYPDTESRIAPLSLFSLKKTSPPPLTDEGVDWRKSGAVAPIKTQGTCGSCWAHTAAANIESVWKIKKGGPILDLSPQQLVDCDDLSHGCDGGSVLHAFDAVKLLGGLNSYTEYPYIGRKHSECLQLNVTKSTPTPYINSSVILPDDEEFIAHYIQQNGPVSIAVNAKPWRFYKGGVMQLSAQNCDPDDQNHAVLLVGFGADQLPYWLIKNSWGTRWGEEGFIRIARGHNTCGMRRRAKAPIIH